MQYIENCQTYLRLTSNAKAQQTKALKQAGDLVGYVDVPVEGGGKRRLITYHSVDWKSTFTSYGDSDDFDEVIWLCRNPVLVRTV